MSNCRGGCGFFGSEANKGYCSHCFKKLSADQINDVDFDQWKKDNEEKVKKVEEENMKKRMEDLEREESYSNPKKKKKPNVEEKKWPPLTAEAKAILETEYVFSHIAQYLTPADVSHFGSSCKSFHKIGQEENVWRNLYETKFGKKALKTLVGDDKKVCSVWKDQVNEISSLQNNDISLADFEKKPYLLQAQLFQKVSVLAPLDQVNSPWSHLKDKDVKTIIQELWNPIVSSVSDLVFVLEKHVKCFYVVREKTDDENWYLLYILKDEEELSYLSAEPPLKNAEEFNAENWGIIPTSLAQFYSVHNGITSFGRRLDSWENGVCKSELLTVMEGGEDSELQILQFNNDGAGNGQSFIQESGATDKDPLTGDFDHENPFELNPETPFFEFVEEELIAAIEKVDR